MRRNQRGEVGFAVVCAMIFVVIILGFMWQRIDAITTCTGKGPHHETCAVRVIQERSSRVGK